MRFFAVLSLLIAALAHAQLQAQFGDALKGWYDKAQSFIKPAAVHAADAGAAAVAEYAVTPLTKDNFRDVIQHSGEVKQYNPPEAWMVYISGGNKSCMGMCGPIDKAWNESVALFTSDVSAPKLASIDCETQEVLCGAWAVDIPSIWMILVPQPLPDQSAGPTRITTHPLNITTTTNTDITRIHTRRLYMSVNPYEGILHPFDGMIAKLGLTMPMAYAIWGIAKIPPWAMMVGISLFSRTYMSRRMPPAQPRAQQAPAQS